MKPQLANNLIGMSLAEFDKLYAEFENAHKKRENAVQYTRRQQILKRQRAAGAGRKYKYSLRDRLLITLFGLRAHTTYEVLGLVFKVDKTTVEDNIKYVLMNLAWITGFNIEHPPEDVPKLHSVQEVIEAFPEILMVMDGKD